MKKRKRGAQPGNQNARKHGLYCAPLTPDEICRFWNLLNAEDIAPELAVLRIKVLSAWEHDPGNRRLLRDAARLLAQYYSAKLGLRRIDANRFRKAVLSAIEAARAGQPASGVEGTSEILTERIERALETSIVKSGGFDGTNRAHPADCSLT